MRALLTIALLLPAVAFAQPAVGASDDKAPALSIYRVHPTGKQVTLLDRDRNQFVDVKVGDLLGLDRVTVIEPRRVIVTRTRHDGTKVHFVYGQIIDGMGKAHTAVRTYDMKKLDKGSLVVTTQPAGPSTTPPKEIVVEPASKGEPVLGEIVQPKPSTGPFDISRQKFDSVLLNLGGLSNEVEAEFTKGGIRLIKIEKDSWIASLGFLPGDVVMTVGGNKLRSVDDAATIYAKLKRKNKFDVKLKRGTKTITMRYNFI